MLTSVRINEGNDKEHSWKFGTLGILYILDIKKIYVIFASVATIKIVEVSSQ